MSNSTSRVLPLIMQPIDGNSWICGASCLAMIFQTERFASMDLPREQEEIATHVLAPRPYQPGQFYCDNVKMLNYVLQQGLTAAYISVTDPIETLAICQRNGLEVIILLRFDPNSGAHFVTFSSISENGVFVNDPLRAPTTIDPQKDNQNKKIPLSSLSKLTACLGNNDFEIIVPNSMLVIFPPDSNEPTFIHKCRKCGAEIKLPISLMHQISHVLYPCNHGLYWVQI